jgi:hypothetical protein
MSNEQTAKPRPTYRMYSVLKSESKKAIWQEIGVAWANKDGKGFNLEFTARPLEGAQLVLREPKDKEEEVAA